MQITIFMLGCATSRIASLRTGCVSAWWMEGSAGHRTALMFDLDASVLQPGFVCSSCGYEPGEAEQRAMRDVLLEYVDAINLMDREAAFCSTTPCHIILESGEN